VHEYISENFIDVDGNFVTFVSDGASEDLQQVIDNNDSAAISKQMGNTKVDTIIDLLIKKGMYIYSCEI
jgi:hypothetical protein